MKKRLLQILCVLCCVLLTGCSSLQGTISMVETNPTLAPAVMREEAPQDFEQLSAQRSVAVYLPSRDGRRLIAQYTELTLNPTVIPEETVVRALLAYPMNDAVQPLGKNIVRIGLYGQHPVEVSNGVCTVNLSSSVLQLDYADQYMVCLALAATLSDLGTVDYVNVLVADQPISLDITGNLPAGGTSAHPGEELSVLWDQMDARRTPLGQDAMTQPLTSAVTLYFPLDGERGFLSETRTVSFSGQRADILTDGLLDALSSGAQYLENTASMPDIRSMLEREPEIQELPDGGRRIRLYFVDSLEKRIELLGLDPVSFLGAVSYTILTFVPGVSGLYLYSGNAAITSVSGELQTADGLLKRSQLTDMLKVEKEICMPVGNRLRTTVKTVAWDIGNDPTELIYLLMKGPDEKDVAAGFSRALPEGMDETDILGMAIHGDLLLVNLSPRFERLLRQAGPDSEQLACYSMVNTLCRALGTRRVSFYFEGRIDEYLGGMVYWAGEFRQNNGLMD